MSVAELTCNLRHPMGLRHPVWLIVIQKWRAAYVYNDRMRYISKMSLYTYAARHFWITMIVCDTFQKCAVCDTFQKWSQKMDPFLKCIAYDRIHTGMHTGMREIIAYRYPFLKCRIRIQWLIHFWNVCDDFTRNHPKWFIKHTWVTTDKS